MISFQPISDRGMCVGMRKESISVKFAHGTPLGPESEFRAAYESSYTDCMRRKLGPAPPLPRHTRDIPNSNRDRSYLASNMPRLCEQCVPFLCFFMLDFDPLEAQEPFRRSNAAISTRMGRFNPNLSGFAFLPLSGLPLSRNKCLVLL